MFWKGTTTRQLHFIMYLRVLFTPTLFGPDFSVWSRPKYQVWNHHGPTERVGPGPDHTEPWFMVASLKTYFVRFLFLDQIQEDKRLLWHAVVSRIYAGIIYSLAIWPLKINYRLFQMTIYSVHLNSITMQNTRIENAPVSLLELKFRCIHMIHTGCRQQRNVYNPVCPF